MSDIEILRAALRIAWRDGNTELVKLLTTKILAMIDAQSAQKRAG